MSNELPTPVPTVSPEAKRFWDAAAEGRLELLRCTDCSTVVWYPRAFCPQCGGRALEWFEASGRGTIYSYTVVRRGATGPYAGVMPYVLAYVELDEGPRVLTNIVRCDVDAVGVGNAVQAVFERVEGGTTALLRFAPA